LKHLLIGRAWGSVHDMYSGGTDADMAAPAVESCAWVRADDAPEEVSNVRVNQQEFLHPQAAQWLLTRVNAKGVWHDHATGSVFAPGTQTTLIPWAFKPHYWHWLQAGWVKP
jgi:hypothetical protein